MFLDVTLSKFLVALRQVHSIIEKRGVLPILGHVKIEVKNGRDFTLTTTDMDITAVSSFQLTDTEISKKISDNVAFTVLAQALYEMLRKASDCDISRFSLDKILKGIVGISVGDRSDLDAAGHTIQFKLPCLPVSTFPSFEELPSGGHLFYLTLRELKMLFNNSKHAISNEEDRYYLRGVYLHTVKKDNGGIKLAAVATDAHRMAKIEVDLPEGASGIPGVIVPKKTVLELLRLIDECEQHNANVCIEIAGNKIKFVIPEVKIISKLIDGTFPNYHDLLKISQRRYAVFKTKALARAIDLVSTVVQGRIKLIAMTFADNKLIVSVENQIGDYAFGMQELYASSSTCGNIEILINAKYLLDALQVIPEEEVEIFISNSVEPVLIRGKDQDQAVYMLMPMQFST